jgi:hypothetical protein
MIPNGDRETSSELATGTKEFSRCAAEACQPRYIAKPESRIKAEEAQKVSKFLRLQTHPNFL